MNMRLSLIALMLIVFTSPVFAKRFTSQFAEFELPAGWECGLEGSEWVCQSTNEDRKREAIIILAAKTRGQQDSLDAYQTYLKGKKTFALPGGKTQVSEPKYTKVTTVNGQQWIDALHLASEVPGFYTRYLATVKENLGVAVTFSVGKDFYDAYAPVFDKVVQTLRVFAQAAGGAGNVKLKGQGEDLLDSAYLPEGQNLDGGAAQKKGKGGGGGKSEILLIVILVAAVGGFIIWKKKKKG